MSKDVLLKQGTYDKGQLSKKQPGLSLFRVIGDFLVEKGLATTEDCCTYLLNSGDGASIPAGRVAFGGVSGLTSNAEFVFNDYLDVPDFIRGLYFVSDGTGSNIPPIGTTAQRGPASEGRDRYNSTIGGIEYYNGTTWIRLSSTQSPSAALGVAAGSGASVSVSGNDVCGSVQFQSGTGSTNGNPLFRVTFASAYSSQPVFITIIPTNNIAAQLFFDHQLFVTNNVAYFEVSANLGSIPLLGSATFNYTVHQ